MSGVPGLLFEVGGPIGDQEYVPIMRERVAFNPNVRAWWADASLEQKAAAIQEVAESYGRAFFERAEQTLGPLEGQARVMETVIDADHPEGFEQLR